MLLNVFFKEKQQPLNASGVLISCPVSVVKSCPKTPSSGIKKLSFILDLKKAICNVKREELHVVLVNFQKEDELFKMKKLQELVMLVK